MPSFHSNTDSLQAYQALSGRRIVPQKPTLRAALLRGYREAATDAGLNAASLLASVNIEPSLLRNPEARIVAMSACQLLDRSARLSGRLDFGLRVAMSQGHPDFGPLALLLREQLDVRAALRVLSDNLDMNTDVFSVKLVEGLNFAVIQQDFQLDMGSAGLQMIELTCARLVQIIRQLITGSWKPRVVCFSHMPPANTTLDSAIFGCPVEYGHSITGIVIAAADLDMRLSGANEDLKRHAEAYLGSLRVNTKLPFDQVVANLLIGQLRRGSPSADRVAEQLGITRRTLNRQLELFGHSYSSILRIVREEKLAALMAQDEKPLSQISAELGFRHQSAFSAWFHELFSCAPSQWRRSGPKPETAATRMSRIHKMMAQVENGGGGGHDIPHSME